MKSHMRPGWLKFSKAKKLFNKISIKCLHMLQKSYICDKVSNSFSPRCTYGQYFYLSLSMQFGCPKESQQCPVQGSFDHLLRYVMFIPSSRHAHRQMHVQPDHDFFFYLSYILFKQRNIITVLLLLLYSLMIVIHHIWSVSSLVHLTLLLPYKDLCTNCSIKSSVLLYKHKAMASSSLD